MEKDEIEEAWTSEDEAADSGEAAEGVEAACIRSRKRPPEPNDGLPVPLPKKMPRRPSEPTSPLPRPVLNATAKMTSMPPTAKAKVQILKPHNKAPGLAPLEPAVEQQLRHGLADWEQGSPPASPTRPPTLPPAPKASSTRKPRPTSHVSVPWDAAPSTPRPSPPLPRRPPPSPARPPMPEPPKSERVAMLVLARHSARLGVLSTGASGELLENSVKIAVERTAAGRHQARWHFMFDDSRMEEYLKLRTQFDNIYQSVSPYKAADKKVRELMQHVATQGQDELPHLSLRPSPMNWSTRIVENSPYSRTTSGLMEVETQLVRFSHDSQSEFFVHGPRDDGQRTILQLVIELVTGQTDLSNVEPFDVCWHEGFWWCRSGNRRLAAYRLAQRCWKQRFSKIWVKIVPLDDIFLHGNNRGKRPKLTSTCGGCWLRINETGEIVGHGCSDAAKDALAGEFGTDLLSLLPGFASRMRSS